MRQAALAWEVTHPAGASRTRQWAPQWPGLQAAIAAERTFKISLRSATRKQNAERPPFIEADTQSTSSVRTYIGPLILHR